MSNLLLSFSVVFPLFCMMALGYFLKIIKVFNDTFLEQLNNLCFKVFLPLLLFINVYQSDFKTVFSAKLVLFALLCVLACFAILMWLIPRIEKENKKRGVMIQGIFRSNFILFAIPITTSLFGEGGASVAAILVAFVVPFFNALSVVALESFTDQKTQLLDIGKSVIKNPLIIASLIAFIFVLTGLKLPQLVEHTIADTAKIATPLALIILGGSFAFKGLNHAVKALTISVLGKLIFVPLVFISISILLGFRGVELVVLFAMFASPTAVSSYTMAQSSDADSVLAGQIVVIDSILSIITIFIGISILKALSL